MKEEIRGSHISRLKEQHNRNNTVRAQRRHNRQQTNRRETRQESRRQMISFVFWQPHISATNNSHNFTGNFINDKIWYRNVEVLFYEDTIVIYNKVQIQNALRALKFISNLCRSIYPLNICYVMGSPDTPIIDSTKSIQSTTNIFD